MEDWLEAPAIALLGIINEQSTLFYASMQPLKASRLDTSAGSD